MGFGRLTTKARHCGRAERRCSIWHRRLGMTRPRPQASLGFWKELNELHRGRHPEHEALVPRRASYELAFRLHAQMPEVVDLSKE